MERRIRMGMIGGGPGSLIGPVHRRAAAIDGKIELVAGCFCRTPEQNHTVGQKLFLAPERIYDNYRSLFAEEAKRPDKIDFVTIVTPNNSHYEIAMAALEAGFSVVCEKPVSITLDEALKLYHKVQETQLQFCVTHTYTAYPMVRQARDIVRAGELGEIRKIIVEYSQGWLAHDVGSENRQGSWRTNPALSGISGCMADIGCHARHLAEYISGLEITELCADVRAFVPGRLLDDDGSVLLHFNNGAGGVLMASQIALGEENALKIRIYGTQKSLEWSQEIPENLMLRTANAPMQVLRRNWASQGAQDSRLPAGHPEGFLITFANIYSDWAKALVRESDGL